MTTLTLVSYPLCPYVQRAAIALAEKQVRFVRRDVDLGNKPYWFKRISPQGKVPLLLIQDGGNEAVLFESAAILEYLDETAPPRLHPADPIERAQHRGWIEFGSSILNGIASYYNAPDEQALARAAEALRERFFRLEEALGPGPWFSGSEFSLVDAVFGPVFRYFDVLDRIHGAAILVDLPGIDHWRARLRERPSVRDAVAPDYPERLTSFLLARRSAISQQLAA